MPCNELTQGCGPSTAPATDALINPNFMEGPDATGNAFQHYAHMGWVGFVVLDVTGGGNKTHLRVTGADINLSQEVNTADVIDGRIDRTAYWLGPKIVEGTLNLPVVADTLPESLSVDGECPAASDISGSDSVAANLLNTIWDWAVVRDHYGRLCYDRANLDIRYANHAAFQFQRCLVNELTMNVTQGDMVTFDLSVIGRNRRSEGYSTAEEVLSQPQSEYFLSPARVLTWNDITINGIGGCTTGEADKLFFSNQVREFSMTVANNADRFYTLNGSLFPVDINVGKREITGSMTLLGLNHRLRELAETNQNRFTEKNEIRLAAYIGNDVGTGATEIGDSRDWTTPIESLTSTDYPANSIWARRLASVVFQIEEISMSNDVIETTVNYLALASDKDEANYEALIPASSCGFPAWS